MKVRVYVKTVDTKSNVIEWIKVVALDSVAERELNKLCFHDNLVETGIYRVKA